VSSHEDWSISTTPHLRPNGFPTAKGGDVLGVGIDWAEEFHLVALGRPGEGVIEVMRVEHSPRAVDALVARIAELEPDPGEVRVVFFPFAAAVTGTGAVEMVGGYSGEERPPSQAVIDLLYQGLADRARGGEIQASGVCFDVRLRGATTPTRSRSRLNTRAPTP
jgi:hypothetical protein